MLALFSEDTPPKAQTFETVGLNGCGKAVKSTAILERGDDTVGNPHRAQISQFEFFELILSLKSDKQFPVEQFETTVSRSTVPSSPLKCASPWRTGCPLKPSARRAGAEKGGGIGGSPLLRHGYNHTIIRH